MWVEKATTNLDVGDLLVCELEGVEQTGAGDDGRAVLVVMHDGDVHALLHAGLNVEALRGLDVLKVDAAESGLGKTKQRQERRGSCETMACAGRGGEESAHATLDFRPWI